MPGIDSLPQELLVEILKHLSYADRMTCATTSKCFAEALTHPQLLKKIWFTVRRYNGIERAAPVLAKSCRRYKKLRLIRVELYKFDSEFWGRIGGTLRRLALNECRWTPEVLHHIFGECSSLEYISITCDRVRQILPEHLRTCGTSIGDVDASLRNLQHLHLRTVSVDVLDHLLDSIPNTATISLQVSGKAFLWETLINRTLADPLIVTGVDLSFSSAFDAELILIMREFSGTLRELRLECDNLTSRAGAAIAECSKLRRLSLRYFDELENIHVTTILRSNPSLEMLDLTGCDSLTDEGLSPIHELRKLRRLYLFGCGAITNEFLCRLGEILTLEYLDLGSTQLDSKIIQCIASLKNLKGLFVDNQTPESLKMICSNLGELRILSLGDCRNLSDADGSMLVCLRRLRTLSFSYGPKFRDLAIEGGVGGPEMESLTAMSTHLTDLGLLSLVGQQNRLRNIDLSYCYKITDQGLVALLQRASLLEKLRVVVCRCIGNRFIEALVDCCPRLRSVEIRDCPTSRRAVKLFRKRRPTVRVYFEPRESD